jgi:NADPH2:quinone reductase
MSAASDTARAYRIDQVDGEIRAGLTEVPVAELGEGEVLIRARYSDVNYKDALAATGAGRILRRFPLVGGIDVAGEVVESSDDRYRPGDPVLVTGCGLGEAHDGGYADYARVPGDWVIPVPDGLGLRDAMVIGTAGFTAALAVHQLQHNGQQPGHGPIAVTGATGGVGSLAIDMLAGQGFEVVAITGKADQREYLEGLGAAEILPRGEIELRGRPLDKVRFGGAVDNLGGELLAWLLSTTAFFGSVASIGLAASPKLETTVMPFILRGVNLLGINSVETPRPLRLRIWERLAGDLRPRHLDRIGVREIGLGELDGCFQAYLDGRVVGRTLVAIGEP